MFTEEFEKLNDGIEALQEQIKENEVQRKLLYSKRRELEQQKKDLEKQIKLAENKPIFSDEVVLKILGDLPLFAITKGDLVRKRDYFNWFKEHYGYEGSSQSTVDSKVKSVYYNLRHGRFSLETLNSAGALLGEDLVQGLLDFYRKFYDNCGLFRGLKIYPFEKGMHFHFCDSLEEYLERLDKPIELYSRRMIWIEVPVLKGKYLQDSAMLYLLHFYFEFNDFDTPYEVKKDKKHQFGASLAQEYKDLHDDLIELLKSKA